jgi:hypothetical protein
MQGMVAPAIRPPILEHRGDEERLRLHGALVIRVVSIAAFGPHDPVRGERPASASAGAWREQLVQQARNQVVTLRTPGKCVHPASDELVTARGSHLPIQVSLEGRVRERLGHW